MRVGEKISLNLVKKLCEHAIQMCAKPKLSVEPWLRPGRRLSHDGDIGESSHYSIAANESLVKRAKCLK